MENPLQLIALLVTVLGICATFYYFRYNNRPKRLAFGVVVSKLIQDDDVSAPQHQIVVVHDEKSVTDPHLVAILLTNIGNKDIGTDDFDGKKPLCVDIGANVVAILKPGSQTVDAKVENQKLLIEPTMLPRNKEFAVKLLVDGSPEVALEEHRLLDTDIWDQRQRTEKAKNVRQRLRGVMRVCVVVMLTAFAIFMWGASVQSDLSTNERNMRESAILSGLGNPSAVETDARLRDAAEWVAHPYQPGFFNPWWMGITAIVTLGVAIIALAATLYDLVMLRIIRRTSKSAK